MKTRLAIWALLLAIAVASPQPAAAQSPFGVQPLGNGIFIVTFAVPGFNMNNLVVVDDDRIILVDTLPALGPDLYNGFRSVIHAVTANRPVDTLINTSWHFDHVGFDGLFRQEPPAGDGTENILAHWGVEHYLGESFLNEDLPPGPFNPSPPTFGAEPTFPVRGEARLELQNETIVLKTVENAHSNADLFVFLEKANVLYTGDIYFGGIYPIIDRPNGGTLNGTLAALRKVLAWIDDETVVVPSHGQVGTRQSLIEFVEMLESYHWQVRQLMARGFTEQEVMDDPSFTVLDARWFNPMTPFVDGPHFRKILYRDLGGR